MRYTFKLIMAGDGGVGKTTLVNKYVHGTFSEDTRITLGVQFMVKRLNIDGNPIDLQIWDFGGEDRFRFLLPAYCRGAHGAIFMYDVTNPTSLFHIDGWLSVLRSQGGKFPIVMGGTKVDVKQDRKVPIEEATSVAHRSGIFAPIEVSSKTGQNVEALFENLCLQMMKASRPEIAAIPVRPVTQGIRLISRV
jgi:small GTP-binding protein